MSHHIKTKFDWIVYSELGIWSEGMIYFLVSLCRFFRFYSVLNLPRHNSKHKLSLIWTSFLFFFSFFCFFWFFCWFFLAPPPKKKTTKNLCFIFPMTKNQEWFKKKGRKFPCRQYMCRFALQLSNLPFFLNVRQTGFLYLLICIYVIFKMLDSLYEKKYEAILNFLHMYFVCIIVLF